MYRLSEREHEDTVLTGAVLHVTCADGERHAFPHHAATLNLSLGEVAELRFDLPPDIAVRAVRSSLTVSGHYMKFGPERVARLVASLAA